MNLRSAMTRFTGEKLPSLEPDRVHPIVMNQPGITDRFAFQESPGVNRIAWLTETRFKAIGTADAQWMIDAPNATPEEWLMYLGTNGEPYHIRIHCHGIVRPYIKVWGENERLNGNERIEPQTWFDIRDWSDAPWRVEILNVSRAPAAPQFKLTPL